MAMTITAMIRRRRKKQIIRFLRAARAERTASSVCPRLRVIMGGECIGYTPKTPSKVGQKLPSFNIGVCHLRLLINLVNLFIILSDDDRHLGENAGSEHVHGWRQCD